MQHGLSAKLSSLEKHVFQSAAKREVAHPWRMKEYRDPREIQMRFRVLDCTFPRDTECFLLPVTGDKAGEDVCHIFTVRASVPDTWWCSPCSSTITPTALSFSPFTQQHHTRNRIWACQRWGCRRRKLLAHNHYGNGCREKSKHSCWARGQG